MWRTLDLGMSPSPVFHPHRVPTSPGVRLHLQARETHRPRGRDPTAGGSVAEGRAGPGPVLPPLSSPQCAPSRGSSWGWTPGSAPTGRRAGPAEVGAIPKPQEPSPRLTRAVGALAQGAGMGFPRRHQGHRVHLTDAVTMRAHVQGTPHAAWIRTTQIWTLPESHRSRTRQGHPHPPQSLRHPWPAAPATDL